MTTKQVYGIRFMLVAALGVLLAGCVGSYSSVRPQERKELLAQPNSASTITEPPYEGAEHSEELVQLDIKIPGFPEWRRYYWTDKMLWGNRGYIVGGPDAELIIKPETLSVLGRYEPILEDLRLKLDMVEKPEDKVAIIDEPVYDQHRAFEAQRKVEESSRAGEHTVRKGESLWLIAGYSEVYGNPLEWPKIFQANRDRILNPNLIYPGQTFRIPREGQTPVAAVNPDIK